MRTAFITTDLLQAEPGAPFYPGGCAYYRCMLPKNAAGPGAVFGRPAYVAQYGYGSRVGTDHAVFGFDTVVTKLLMDRWTTRLYQGAQRLGQRIIVDVDDAYDFLHEENQAYWVTHPDRNKATNRDHYRQSILQADTVTVSTPFLLDYYQSIGCRDVRLIRNGINPKQFTRHKQTTAKPVLGWPGALRWRSNDVDVLRDWLPGFLTDHDLQFHHVGHAPDSPAFADLAGVDPNRVTTTPLAPLAQYAASLTFDIGIVPLSDIPFNHAKSTIKGLEMAASGIPFVASDLPEYRLLAEQGVGRVASTPDEWVRHLTELLDYDTRKKEAARQRAIVLRDHTISARAHEWVDVLRESPVTNIPAVKIPYRDV